MKSESYVNLLQDTLSKFSENLIGLVEENFDIQTALTVAEKCGMAADSVLSDITAMIERGDITLEEGQAVIAQVMNASAAVSERYSIFAQESVNKQAGVNVQALGADKGEVLNRIRNLIRKYGEYEELKDGNFLLKEPIQGLFSKDTVINVLKRNADFHESIGLKVKIIRRGGSNCCKWCAKQDGVYDKENAPKDIWRFHKNCKCTIEYTSGF